MTAADGTGIVWDDAPAASGTLAPGVPALKRPGAAADSGIQWDSSTTAAPASAAPTLKDPRSFARAAGDIGVGLGEGLVSAGMFVPQLANTLTGGAVDNYAFKPITGAVDRALGGPGEGRTLAEASQDTRSALDELKSPQLRQKEQELADTKGFLPSAKKILTDPALLTQQIAEQVPQLIAPGGVVRKAGAVAFERAAGSALAKGIEKRVAAGMTEEAATAAAQKAAERVGRRAAIDAGTKAAIGTEAAMSGSQNSEQAQQEVMGMDQKVLDANPDYQAMIARGVPPQQARETLAQQAGVRAGLAGAAITAATGGITGRLESKIFQGETGIEGVGKLLTGTGAKELAKATGKEFTQEALQEGGEQFGQNLGVQSVDPNKDLMDQVPEQAALGGVIGGVLGGGTFAGSAAVAHPRTSVPNPGAAPGSLSEAANVLAEPAGPMGRAAQAAQVGGLRPNEAGAAAAGVPPAPGADRSGAPAPAGAVPPKQSPATNVVEQTPALLSAKHEWDATVRAAVDRGEDPLRLAAQIAAKHGVNAADLMNTPDVSPAPAGAQQPSAPNAPVDSQPVNVPLPWVNPQTGEVGTPTKGQLTQALADYITQTFDTQGHMRVNAGELADAWGVPKADISRVRQRATQMATQQVRAGVTGNPVAEQNQAPAADEPQAAAPAPSDSGTTASIPFMITQAMKRDLRGAGHSDADIARMTPEQANAALQSAGETTTGATDGNERAPGTEAAAPATTGAEAAGPANAEPAAVSDRGLSDASQQPDATGEAAVAGADAAGDANPAVAPPAASGETEEAKKELSSAEKPNHLPGQPEAQGNVVDSAAGRAGGEAASADTPRATGKAPQEEAATPRARVPTPEAAEPAPAVAAATQTPPTGGVSASGAAPAHKVSAAARDAEGLRIKTPDGETNGRSHVDSLIKAGFTKVESHNNGKTMQHALVNAAGERQPIKARQLKYAQEAAARESGTPVKESLTAGQKRTSELLGAGVGDTVRTTGMGAEIQPGSTWKIERIDKDGTLHTSSPGGGTGSFKRGELEREVRKGATFEKVAPAKSAVEAAAVESAAHPDNNLPDPTPAQHSAGNFQMGHVRLHGLDVSIEIPKGGMRRGIDAKGKAWERELAHHYGYIRRTEAADGEQVDVYLGPHAEDASSPVFVVDQVKPGTKVYDESKVMLGYATGAEARKAYDSNFPKDVKTFGAIRKMSLDEFKTWLKEGDTTKPVVAAPVVNQQMTTEPAAPPATIKESSKVAAKTAPKRGGIATNGAKVRVVGGKLEYVSGARETLEAYFTPGRLVNGYGGTDKVLAFEWNDGNWRVQVQEVNKDGSPLASGGARNAIGEPRWHGTRPDMKEMLSVLGKPVLAESPAKAPIATGDRVQVKRGAYKGKTGTVSRVGGTDVSITLDGGSKVSIAKVAVATAPVETDKAPAALFGRDTEAAQGGLPLFSIDASGQKVTGRIAATFADARKAAADFIGKPIENENGLVPATVSGKTLGKMLSKSAVEKSTSLADHVRAVANVDALYRIGVLDESGPDARGEPTIAAIHRVVAPMVGANGEVLAVKMTVKETTGANSPNPLYTVETLDVTKPALLAPQGGIEPIPGQNRNIGQAGFSADVTRMLEEFKRRLPLFRQTNDTARTAAPVTAAQEAHTARIKQIATAAMGKWKGDDVPSLRVVATPEQLPAAAKVAANGLASNAYKTAAGMYDGRTIWIVASAHKTDQAGIRRILTTMAHEGVGHYGVERIVERELGADAWTKIESATERLRANPALASPAIREVLASVGGRYRGADAPTFAREFLAVSAERGVKNGLLDRAITAIRSWLRQVMPDLRLSEHELRQLLVQSDQYLRVGESQQQRLQSRAAMAFSRDDQTDTPAFKRFFGDSKVVDATGNPLPVFHGTADDFDAFDPNRSGSATAHMTATLGSFFAEDRSKAQHYAENASQGVPAEERVIDAYLSIQKPYEMGMKEFQAIDSQEESTALRKKLIAEGYDGIHLKDVGQWVAFEPAQIKSASENNGQFSRSDARINFSKDDQTQTPAFKSWFAGSKAVDEDGKPLVVYHGTRYKFDAFEPTQPRAAAGNPVGIYFTDDPREAEQFAEDVDGATDARSRVVPAYLSIRNDKDGVIRKRRDGTTEFIVFDPTRIKSAIGNNGAFDPTDPRINFSRDENADPDNPRRPKRSFTDAAASIEAIHDTLPNLDRTAFQQVKDWISGKARDLEPLALGALQLRHVLELASEDPTLKKPAQEYANIYQRMDGDRNSLTIDGAAKVDALVKWARKPGVAGWMGKVRPEAKRLFDFMNAVTQLAVDPTNQYERLLMRDDRNEYKPWTKELIKQRVKVLREVALTRSGDDKTRIYDEIKDLQRLPQREKVREQKYPELVRQWNALTPEAKEQFQVMRDHYRVQSEALEEATLAHIASLDIPEQNKRAAAALVNRNFSEARVDGVYFPLSRFGDYWISATTKDGEYVFAKYESAAAMKVAEKRLLASGATIEARGRQDNNYRAKDAPSGTFIGDLMGVLKNAPDTVKDEIYQMYLKALPNLSLRKHGIHRKNIAGFTDDVPRAFASSVFHGAHQLSKARYGWQLTNTLEQMRERMESRRTVVSGTEAAHADALIGEINRRHDWILNPTNNALSNKATGVAFTYFLGASPASAIVNLIQVPQIVLPVLGAQHGWGKASAALGRAMRQAIGTGGHIDKLLKGEELDAYRELEKQGTFQRSATHALAGISEGDNLRSSPGYTKVMNAVSWMFHTSEVINREATGMAAFRLARQNGQNFQDALKYADQITNGTHGDYSNANRARYMQGNVQKVVLQFKNYSLAMSWLWGRNFYKAFKGEDVATRSLARRTLTGMLGMTGLFAGVIGMPIFNLLRYGAQALHAVGGDDDEPWDFVTEFRSWLAEHLGETAAAAIADGVVSQLGANVASRVSMSDLWFRDADRQLEGEDAYNNMLQSIAGPLGGMIKNMYVGAQQFSDGHTERGIETMLPTFAKNAVKATRFASQGVNTLRGDPIVADVSAPQALIQAMGFAPTKVAEQQRINNALFNYQKFIQDRRQQLMNAFAMAQQAGDDDGRGETLAKIQAFNQKYPEIAIRMSNLHASLRQRARFSAEADNGIRLNKKLANRVRSDVGAMAGQ
jgi:Inorganic Pyrophosphatase/ADP-Ribosyltransferase in polyvalent proteins/Large polyvalent protein associated domain 39/Large polyvalent protein-associated domain 3